MAGLETSRFDNADPAAVTPSYGDAKYWKLRYTEKAFEPFDWYLKWEQLKDIIAPLLAAESEVLVLGCGTSPLPDQLLAEGLAANVTCVDQCAELIEALKQKYQDKAGLQFENLAASNLPQDYANRFDVVIDKAMLDCVFSGRQGQQQASEVMKAVNAVLKPEGSRYVVVSHMRPAQRLPFLSQTFSGNVTCHAIPKPLAAPDAVPAKGGKAPKGKAAEAETQLELSAACDSEDHAYHVYCCERQ
eukprot:TRINITY_DN37688_c0_g1_i1.p1 TRINITY_DN37688_c0_g1~~TRINITY_DN37688_c0_g1_i1.p1  ORF type:complete len:245 (-),score=69.15 TRINITY_DN37688_c0_g1_i1:51-785(-)